MNIWYLPIHDITDQLGFLVELLPVVHLITGCDSVSSLFGIGKKNAFEILKANSESLTDMRLFGDSTSLSIADNHVKACIKFVIIWKPASNSFVPYMTSHTQNTTLVICDTNYSLKKIFPVKSYHQYSTPYYSNISEQIINVMLRKGLVLQFWNYPILLGMDGWRAEKYWSKEKKFEMLYQKPLLS